MAARGPPQVQGLYAAKRFGAFVALVARALGEVGTTWSSVVHPGQGSQSTCSAICDACLQTDTAAVCLPCAREYGRTLAWRAQIPSSAADKSWILPKEGQHSAEPSAQSDTLPRQSLRGSILGSSPHEVHASSNAQRISTVLLARVRSSSGKLNPGSTKALSR